MKPKHTESTIQSQSTLVGIPNVEITDELEQNINHRGNAYMATRTSGMIDDRDDIIGYKGREQSNSLYCRSSECEKFNLEDFQLVSIIGRGNFGKVKIYSKILQVYLVYLP